MGSQADKEGQGCPAGGRAARTLCGSMGEQAYLRILVIGKLFFILFLSFSLCFKWHGCKMEEDRLQERRLAPFEKTSFNSLVFFEKKVLTTWLKNLDIPEEQVK